MPPATSMRPSASRSARRCSRAVMSEPVGVARPVAGHRGWRGGWRCGPGGGGRSGSAPATRMRPSSSFVARAPTMSGSAPTRAKRSWPGATGGLGAAALSRPTPRADPLTTSARRWGRAMVVGRLRLKGRVPAKRTWPVAGSTSSARRGPLPRRGWTRPTGGSRCARPGRPAVPIGAVAAVAGSAGTRNVSAVASARTMDRQVIDGTPCLGARPVRVRSLHGGASWSRLRVVLTTWCRGAPAGPQRVRRHGMRVRVGCHGRADGMPVNALRVPMSATWSAAKLEHLLSPRESARCPWMNVPLSSHDFRSMSRTADAPQPSSSSTMLASPVSTSDSIVSSSSWSMIATGTYTGPAGTPNFEGPHSSGH